MGGHHFPSAASPAGRDVGTFPTLGEFAMRSRREPSQANGLRIFVAFARYSPRVRGSSRRILGYVVTVVGRNFSCEVPSCRLTAMAVPNFCTNRGHVRKRV
jgi:hypothetical protein